MKKYEILLDEEYTIEFIGRTLHRIRALKDFGNVKKGDLGGYIQNESNLSQDGNCWIYNDAKAMDDSRVYDNSKMYNNSVMYDYSKMYNNSEMYDNSIMSDDSIMYDNSKMYNNSEMYGYSKMFNNSVMSDYSRMYDNSEIRDNSRMCDNSKMYSYSIIYNDGELKNNEILYGKLYTKVDNFIEINNPDCKLVTCVKKGNEILYNIGCQNEINEETFRWRIENEDGGLEKHPYRKEYYKIIKMAKLYFSENI